MGERASGGRHSGAEAASDFAKIPPEAVAEELTRFDTELAARKKAEAERFAAAQAELKQ